MKKPLLLLLLILTILVIVSCSSETIEPKPIVSLSSEPIEPKSVVHSKPIPYDDFCTIIKRNYADRSQNDVGNDYNDMFYDLQKFCDSVYDLEGFTEENFITLYQRYRKILYYAENQGFNINDEKYNFWADVVVSNINYDQKGIDFWNEFAKSKNISFEEALQDYIIPFAKVDTAARGVLLTYYQKNVYNGIFQKYSEEYDRLQKEAGDKGESASDYYSTKEFQTAFIEYLKDFEAYVETLEYKE